MAVGHYVQPELVPVSGIRLSGLSAGIKKNNSADLMLVEICEGASVSAVFTQNAFCAEPVKICRRNLREVPPRFLLTNSGNANACTGELGANAAMATCEQLAKICKVQPNQILPFSTGVIGEVLPADLISAALPKAVTTLKEDSWLLAAEAIMTTDTRAKGTSKVVMIEGERIVISGIAKGAGMIKPNMGTMLAYVATDATVDNSLLNEMCQIAANASFNRITVDGDTSTNDSFVLIATNKVGPIVSDRNSEAAKAIQAALIELCQSLAIEMVRDAEGATKCVRVDVKNGASNQESLDVAYAICHSPLVKTALFASDANWGRIVAAIGYAGLTDLEVEKVKVWLDDVLVVENGGRALSYSEEKGADIFGQEEFTISVDLARGACNESLWTSDLSHDYIRINAEYRT